MLSLIDAIERTLPHDFPRQPDPLVGTTAGDRLAFEWAWRAGAILTAVLDASGWWIGWKLDEEHGTLEAHGATEAAEAIVRLVTK